MQINTILIEFAKRHFWSSAHSFTTIDAHYITSLLFCETCHKEAYLEKKKDLYWNVWFQELFLNVVCVSKALGFQFT